LFVLYLIARASTGAMYEARYMLSMLPFYMLLLSLGLLAIAPFLARWNAKAALGIQSVVILLATLILVQPAYWSMRLAGKPTPYKLITEWVDANLPRGTPVLVDRWFEPWNELAVYASTNVFYTFTIPNEPIDTFLKYEWRKTAEEFLKKFPDAAYLEITKEYWDVPGVGDWNWPRQFFARHVVFKNEPGVKLRNIGLSARGDFYAANTNRLIVELFYNTPRDVLDQAKAAGKRTVVLYGEGWGYTKLWRQIQGDFRDWRVLENQAPLDIYNQGSTSLNVQVVMSGVAPGTPKVVTVTPTGESFTFPMSRIVEWKWKTLSLAPGLNRFVLKTNGRPGADAPVLIGNIAVLEIP
ncbi:MAG: hypothetical protein V2A34_02815, partial [Lentisphaerota bacterium]